MTSIPKCAQDGVGVVHNAQPLEKRLVHLDLVRGMAALLVCASHLRGFWFPSYRELAAPNAWHKAFYFVTGLGHQNVMIFFVLSGFFITGSVADSFARNRWSWRSYAVNRLVRLWVVLLPALALTFFWDRLGMLLTHQGGYQGSLRDLVNSGPAPLEPAVLGIGTLIANLFFLQTIMAPVYGTNGPLWSLANEFWYYALFPLLFQMCHRQSSTLARIMTAAIAIVLLVLLPRDLLLLGIVWLMGFAVYLVRCNPQLQRHAGSAFVFLVMSVALVVVLAWSRSNQLRYSDFLIGAAFAGMVPFLARRSNTMPVGTTTTSSALHAYRWVAEGLSNISYTLYLVHFPILAFVRFFFARCVVLQPSAGGYALYFAALAATVLYAIGVWWIFERQTSTIRAVVRRVVG